MLFTKALRKIVANSINRHDIFQAHLCSVKLTG